MMTSATKNPAPDRAAKTGLTWALCCLVVNGSVEADTGRCPPIPGMGAKVVVVADVVGVVM